MTEKELKQIIKEEYHKVKNYMESEYGFTPELGKVMSNPYVNAFTSVNEGFKAEYKGNDDIIWKRGKTRGDVTNFTPYYKGHAIDFGGYNFKTEKELKDFIKDYILSNQLYNKYRFESVNENKVDKLRTAVQKINRKYQVKVSTHPVTKGEIEIILGRGNHPDSVYHSIEKLVSKLGFKRGQYSIFDESVNEAYVIFYAKKKGDKPSQAAYRDKDMALKFEKDLKKDGYITMVTQKKIKGVDESVNEVSNDYSPMAYAKLVAKGKMSMEKAMKDSGYPFIILSKLVRAFDRNYKFEGNESDADMAVDQLQSSIQHAQQLVDKLKSRSNLEPWVQSLITKAEDYLNIVNNNDGGEEEIDEYDVENYQDVKEFVEFMENYKPSLNEAEYQGRKVELGKIMQGDVKKFKVYVNNDKGNVVKVNFGQKGMVIKKDNPDARKSFRARMNCDEPGPRWKARYWSCRKW